MYGALDLSTDCLPESGARVKWRIFKGLQTTDGSVFRGSCFTWNTPVTSIWQLSFVLCLCKRDVAFGIVVEAFLCGIALLVNDII